MSAPVFKQGDFVEYEMSPDMLRPRYDGHRDLGYSGKFTRAFVYKVTSDMIKTVPIDESYIWFWPMPGSEFYQDSQWSRPGYMRKVQPASLQSPCTCGAEKAKTTHSHWCDSCR